MSYWAVAQTETQREHTARMFLMRENYETYAPRIKKQGRILPLFPSYIFVRIQSAWYRARWSVGVTKILMDGEKPAQLSDAVVESIRGREVDGLVTLPRAPKFQHGQRVRVIRRGSSFEGMIGIYAGMSGIDRERVLLDLLGRKTAVLLPTKDVAALG